MVEIMNALKNAVEQVAELKNPEKELKIESDCLKGLER